MRWLTIENPFRGIRFHMTNLLENRNFNITPKFACIFKIFKDFTFIQKLREDIERVQLAVRTAL